jgi:hypothetical protein
MEIELRRTASDDPAALSFAMALRDEVEARGADNAAARPRTPLAEAVMADIETLVAYDDDRPVGDVLEGRSRARGFKAIRLDTHDRLIEANRLYRSRGYREIPDYNSNPRSNRWYEKRLVREGT